MKRRSFLKNAALTGLGASTTSLWSLNSKNFFTQSLQVNSPRIEHRLFELAKFGRNDKGQGYRVAYTQGDIEGRAWLMELMKRAGLNPSIDTGGNIIGKRKGKNASHKPIAFGSHIDMVPDGGNYDGVFGSIAALEVIEILNENNLLTEHPLEVIIFANEEGGTVGSKAMVGTLTESDLNRVTQSGLTIREGLKVIGGNPDNLPACIRQKGDYTAFIELHIEQGGLLESENIQIGVVEGIVGMRDWGVTIEGFANHAGATPMNMRQDALLAASKLVVAVNYVINKTPGRHVGTVGKNAAFPGATNVIPGSVQMSLEIRDLSIDRIEQLFNEIQQEAAAISKVHKVKISFAQDFELFPAIANEKVKKVIEEVAKKMQLSRKFMQSGAYHDTAQMATIAPIGMIFVPSIGGISHSPKEFTQTIDMKNGANVLLQTILTIDKEF
ncbi:MAG: Zn-dependent hydrolase [Spirosomataceae bacterium]